MDARNPNWRGPFLEALRHIPVVQHACEAANTNRTMVYKARKADPEFAKAWDDAVEAGIDRAEQEAYRRAVVGYEEPVVYQGQLTPVWARDKAGDLITETYDTGEVYGPKHEKAGQPIMGTRPLQARDENGNPVWLTVRKHSDPLLALFLKGRRKAVYADRTELTSPDGSMSPANDEGTRVARLAQLQALAEQRRKAAEVPPDFDLA